MQNVHVSIVQEVPLFAAPNHRGCRYTFPEFAWLFHPSVSCIVRGWSGSYEIT